MSIITSFLIWVGIGFSIGIGICLVFAVISLLMKVYETLFPKKEQLPFDDFEIQVALAGEHCIFLSPRLFSQFDREKSLKDLRKELWHKDIVVPDFYTKRITKKREDFNCLIGIGGAKLFKGMIAQENSETETTEKIISEIRKLLLTDEAKNMTEEKGDTNEHI